MFCYPIKENIDGKSASKMMKLQLARLIDAGFKVDMILERLCV